MRTMALSQLLLFTILSFVLRGFCAPIQASQADTGGSQEVLPQRRPIEHIRGLEIDKEGKIIPLFIDPKSKQIQWRTVVRVHANELGQLIPFYLNDEGQLTYEGRDPVEDLLIGQSPEGKNYMFQRLHHENDAASSGNSDETSTTLDALKVPLRSIIDYQQWPVGDSADLDFHWIQGTNVIIVGEPKPTLAWRMTYDGHTAMSVLANAEALDPAHYAEMEALAARIEQYHQELIATGQDKINNGHPVIGSPIPAKIQGEIGEAAPLISPAEIPHGPAPVTDLPHRWLDLRMAIQQVKDLAPSAYDYISRTRGGLGRAASLFPSAPEFVPA